MAIRTIFECTNGCPACGPGNYSFCGSDTVESEICLVPSIDREDIARVEVEVLPENFNVELVCCNLIVVCGFITKRVFRVNPNPELPPIQIKEKDIPVQIKVPAEICNPAFLNPAQWDVTGVEVCTGCYTLTCPDNIDNDNFHRLIEKDILLVQVDSLPII